MKTFIQYLAEAELQHSQVAEDSNMPSAVDSASPISGKGINLSVSEKSQHKLPNRKQKKYETVSNISRQLSSVKSRHS
jgi:hypothetical protein